MSGDAELERLLAQRRAEMERNLRTDEAEAAGRPDPQEQSPRQILVSSLGYRGLEVLENAERQYPRQTAALVPQLARLISSGELPGKLDGGRLLQVFRLVGLNVRMRTTIKVEKDGKMVSLSEKLAGGGRP